MGRRKLKRSPAKDPGQMKISSFFNPVATGLFTTIKNERPSSDSCRIINGNTSQEKAVTTNRLMETKHINSEKRETASKLISGKDRSRTEPKESGIVPGKTLPVSSFEDTDSHDILIDSDLDIIESTPEAKKCNKTKILPSNITRSPDIIPSTPQSQLDRICRSSQGLKSTSSTSSSFSSKKALDFSESVLKCKPLSLKSKANLSRLHKHRNKKTNISFTNWHDINQSTNGENQCMKPSQVSVKRHARSGTGISPNSKRVNVPDNEVFEIEVENCKSNLLERLGVGESDGCLQEPNNEVGEEENLMEESCKESHEEQQHILVKEELPIIRNSKDTNLFHSIGKDSVKEQVSRSHGTESGLCIENNKIKHTQKLKSASGSLKTNDLLLQESFSSSQGFGSIIDSLDQEFEVEEKSSTSEMKDVFDDILEDNLAATFESMSPFKQEVDGQKQADVRNKQVEKLLKEGVGSESFSSQGKFGRHIVTAVERDAYKGQLLLRLVSAEDSSVRTCTLSGLWSQSMVCEGDIVHILYTDPVDGHFSIDNSKGVIVINPDFLISGTSIVSGVFCRRRTVLNERFKGLDSTNQSMLIGSLVHQLFQKVVKDKIQTREELDRLVRELMSQPKMLRDMYGIGVSEAHIYEEMSNFMPHIHAWSERYLGSGVILPGKGQGNGKQRNQWNGQIVDIQDIEENIWSPKLGLKGKIDLTVKTNEHGLSKVMPLELKTGKPSFSVEHRGQVTLYSMMSADRRQDPKSGLLLYLKNGAMEEIPAGDKEKQGLIQLRNDIIYHLTMKPTQQEGDEPPRIPPLPDPIDFERACKKCAHLLVCSVYQKSIEESIQEHPHTMAVLVPQTTAHLTETHLKYFRHWCLLLHLEIADGRRDAALRTLWCQDAIKREAAGNCLSNLMLEREVPVTELEPGQFVHAFTSTPHTHHSPTKLARIGLQVGDNIVVSSKTEIALSLGAVIALEEDSVKVVLDRNLRLYPFWHDQIFHVDRCEYQNTMSFNFTNLAKLLMDTPRASSLRALIVEKKPPSFKKGLSPDVVSKGKHILKSLNKIQQRAVLKTLMAEDYSLLKGYPGTGKTSTIVAMVRIMVTLGYSILLTSYTHSAVDNILLKLKMHDVDFLRLGRISRIHPDLLPYADEIVTRKFQDVSSLSEFYKSKHVVATTCLGVNHVLFTKQTFDFCIIDEASQVLQVAALGPLFHASRFVLVGDPKQLPPVVQSKQAKNLGMSESLFMGLDSQGATSSLTQQYRMNGPLMKIANHLMYENQLQCANPDLETAILHLPNYNSLLCNSSSNVWLQNILEPSLENSVVFVDTCGAAVESHNGANMVVNNRETEIVVALLQALIEAGVTAEDVGVITPYRAQVKQIRDWVIKEVAKGQKVEVNTVDQYQGRDKSVIIYCCVRSGGTVLDAYEILHDERRLNVAMTRAKYKLIMVGDIATLKLYTPFRKLAAHLEPHQIYRLQEGRGGFMWQDGVAL